MILDASVVFKWIRDGREANHDRAIILLKQHLCGKEKITILPLTLLEIANVLVTKTKVTQKELLSALELIFSLNLELCDVAHKDIKEASMLARKRKTSVYDMLYAVCAHKLQTILITADRVFVKAAKMSHVKLLSDVSI